MRAKAEQGVPPEQHPRHKPQLTDWDAARVFLDVVRTGSFRAAAEQLGISVNVARRRIDDFERQLSARLFTRDVHGTRLTSEGQLVLTAVERMEAASFDLLRARTRASQDLAGEVRVAVTEGLGSFWIAPRLVEFQQAFPRILVDLNCSMTPADVLRHEADISVSLIKPTDLGLKQVKLGRLHVMLFASKRYLETYGEPRTYEELLGHRLVLHVAEQTAARETFASWFPGIPPDHLLAMKTNVSSANYWAISTGVGIGLLPTYASILGVKLVPLAIELKRPFDIWLTYHPDSSRNPRVRRMIDWIVDAFSPAKYPWFRD
jgi:DNA-binding transcriptional LysR family regulator